MDSQQHLDKSFSKEIEPSNSVIAGILNKIADNLELLEDNPFKIRAYRVGAKNIRSSNEKIADLVKKGDGLTLKKMPGVGEALANIIIDFVQNGNSSLLNRLQSEISPEELFVQIPGISKTLAKRIIDTLHTRTFEDLETALYNGELKNVEGIGAKRLKAIQSGINSMLKNRSRIREDKLIDDEIRVTKPKKKSPGVSLLLEIDKEYREKEKEGKLKKIAPKRFNPEGNAWLPIMFAERDDWDFTVLFSNTKAAHDTGKTGEWVVIYYRQNGFEDEVTVVTETKGDLKGKRVIRGRESECREYYYTNKEIS